MSRPKQSKKLSRRLFIKGSAAAGLGVVAGATLLNKTAQATQEIIPPLGSERVLTTCDSEGLINVHLDQNGTILRTSSLGYPEIEASPMGLAWDRRAFAPDRILYPMKRVGWEPGGGGDKAARGQPRYERITWDEALDLVAGELKRVKESYGNEAILATVIAGWQTAGNFNSKNNQMGRFMNMYGGSTKTIGNKSYACWQWAAPYSYGVQYPSDSMGDSLNNTNTFIFWASDPMNLFKVRGTNYRRVREWIAAMKQRGVKIITIDPFYTETAEKSDEWIAIRPSSDSALMAAMAYVMISENLHDTDFLSKYTVGFEPFRAYIMGETDGTPKTPEWAAPLTDLSAEKIRFLAMEYATTPKVKISAARGIQRNDHGEQQVRMLISLVAMKGEFGLPGGGLSFEIPTYAGSADAKVDGKGPSGFPNVANPLTQTILEQHWADEILNPGQTVNHDGKSYPYPEPGKSEIKLIYWMGGSSLNQHDDVNKNIQVLKKMETIIVQDSWWTPAARFADLVLPANTLFEREDMSLWWRYAVFQHKIIESLGESRSDYQIFSDLALRLGFKEQFTEGLSAEGWLRRMYAASNIPLTYEQFKEQGYHKFPIVENNDVAFATFRQDPLANPLKTKSGLIEIHSDTIAGYGYAECPGTPQFMEPFEWLGSEKAKTYPLHMINKHPVWRRHSSYDNVDTLHKDSKINGFEAVFINTQDAAERGIEGGDVVRVFNDRGQVLAGAVVTDRIRSRVIVLQEGSWYSPVEPGTLGSLDRGGSSSVLTMQKGTSELAQGPVCHSNLVQVEKFTGSAKPNDYAAIQPINQ